MRALLDVNVLIALLDAGHVHHAAAGRWLDSHLADGPAAGWASCPLTQNGCLRILSNRAYPRPQPVAAVGGGRGAAAPPTPHHAFWPDDLSVLEPARFAHDRWLDSRQITDAYLLALAVHRGGVFVTLDHGIDISLVTGATPRHLVTI
jgi:toxin-antitoxin system PIN domain toxin